MAQPHPKVALTPQPVLRDNAGTYDEIPQIIGDQDHATPPLCSPARISQICPARRPASDAQAECESHCPTEAQLRELVAKALVNKGATLGALGRGEDAITVYDNLIERFGAATEAPLRELVNETKSLKRKLKRTKRHDRDGVKAKRSTHL